MIDNLHTNMYVWYAYVTVLFRSKIRSVNKVHTRIFTRG